MTEPGRNPQIISGPQPGPSSSGKDNVYSVIKKQNKTSPAPPPAAGGDANVYYVEDKSQKAPPPPLLCHHPLLRRDPQTQARPSQRPNPNERRKGNKPKARTRARRRKQPAASGGEGSRIPNADGLLYSTVDFTEEQRQKEKHHAPLRDNTDYSGLDFAEMAEAARKMSKK
ncbi:hypothetical protein ACOMHN_053329 [Nucella lapillus]